MKCFLPRARRARCPLGEVFVPVAAPGTEALPVPWTLPRPRLPLAFPEISSQLGASWAARLSLRKDKVQLTPSSIGSAPWQGQFDREGSVEEAHLLPGVGGEESRELTWEQRTRSPWAGHWFILARKRCSVPWRPQDSYPAALSCVLSLIRLLEAVICI